MSASEVSATWSAVTGATSYVLFRSSNNGPFVVVPTPIGTATTFNDTGLAPDTAYVYFVCATDGSNTSLSSRRDVATTIVFLDDPVVPGLTLIKATHISQLRTAVNALRIAAGLELANFTDSSLDGKSVKVVHITELRSNVDQARTRLGLAAMAYTGMSLTAGDTIMATHILDLRAGVK